MSKNRDRMIIEPEAVETVSQSEIEALKAQAAADLEAAAAAPAAPAAPAVTAPTPRDVQRAGAPVNPNSIRQTVITALLAGQDTKSIAATLAERFPTSAAAAKSTKHIAFYRAVLRREGKLPKVAR